MSFTLPVLPSGLTADGLAVLRSARAAGVEVSVVNLMAMDYGPGPAPDPVGHMGDYAIAAATATRAQIGLIWTELADDALWAMIGLTPMIGQNDVAGEVFTVADAAQVRAFANNRGLGRLAMWSVTRDTPCPFRATGASPSCSGVDQTPGAFAVGFTGNLAPATTTTPGTTTTTVAPAPPTSVAPPDPAVAPQPVGGNVTGTTRIRTDWGGGYCADVTVTNDGTAPVNWSLSIQPGGPITSLGNGRWTASGPTIEVTGAAWNRTLAAGASTAFDFCATRPVAPPGTTAGAGGAPGSVPPGPGDPAPGGAGAATGATTGTTPAGPMTTSTTQPGRAPTGQTPPVTAPAPAPGPTPAAPTTTSPGATPTPTAPPPAPPTTTAAARVVTSSSVTADWGTGFCTEVTVTNVGGSPTAWSVPLSPGGTVTTSWNVTLAGAGPSLLASGGDWNATLGAGERTTFGYCADR